MSDGRRGAFETELDVYSTLWGVQAGEMGDLPETFVERASKGVGGQ